MSVAIRPVRPAPIWFAAVGLDLITASVVLLLGASLYEFILLVGPVVLASIFWAQDDGFKRFYLVFIPAILLFPTVLRDLDVASSGVRSEHLLIFWGLTALAAGIPLGHKIRVPRTLAILITVWLTVGLVSASWQLAREWSIPELKSAAVAFQGFARPLVILAIFYSVGSGRFAVKSLLLTLTIAGGAVSLLMLLQLIEVPAITQLTLENFDRKDIRVIDIHGGRGGGRGDVVGTFDGQHNQAGLFSVVWISATTMFAMALWTTGRLKWSVIAVIMVLIGYVGLFGTFSRIGFTAAAVAFVTFAGINFRYDIRRSLIGVGVIAGVILVAALALEQSHSYITNRIGGELFDISYVLDDPRVTIVYPHLLAVWKESPLFGNGYDIGTAGDIGYLTELASRGVIGMTVLVILWGYTAWIGWKGAQLRDEFVRGASIAVLAITLAFAVAMIAIHPFLQARVIDIYWVLVAVVVANVNVKSYHIGLSPNIVARLRLQAAR